MIEESGASGRSHKRLAMGLIIVAAVAACVDRSCANFLSFNSRAQSGEGKAAARCLSSPAARTCQWSGWKSWEQLSPTCTQVTCMSSAVVGRRYALKRWGADEADVLAVGVNTYDRMLGDPWLGSDGREIHCVDTTTEPSPVEALLRGDDRKKYFVTSVDPRCAAIKVANIESLRSDIRVGRR